MNSENKDKIISLRHLLHANPELSMQEINTRHFLIDFLKKYTRLEIREYGHWFCALYHAPVPGAPIIAFRADMDALPIPEGDAVPKDHASLHPGVSHKCGHDGHCAALAGFCPGSLAETAIRQRLLSFPARRGDRTRRPGMRRISGGCRLRGRICGPQSQRISRKQHYMPERTDTVRVPRTDSVFSRTGVSCQPA